MRNHESETRGASFPFCNAEAHRYDSTHTSPAAWLCIRSDMRAKKTSLMRADSTHPLLRISATVRRSSAFTYCGRLCARASARQ